MSSTPESLPPWKRLTGWSRLAFSFRMAFEGMAWSWRTQQNFRLDVGAAVLVMGISLACRVSRLEAAMLMLCVGLVMSAELFNTCVESLVDLACPEIDLRAKRIKDLSAASVLIASLTATCVGVIILLPRLLSLL